MKQAGDFLAKFNKLTPPKDALRRTVARVVSSVLGIQVEKGAVKIQNEIAHIDVSPLHKNRLRLERQSILEHLYEQMPKARATLRDIR